MTIDTKIRHVTKRGANRFLEPGFSAAEVKRLHASSQKQINETRLLKEKLMTELSNWIEQHHLKQVQAAEILTGSRPRVSMCQQRRPPSSPSTRCVDMVSRIGKPVTLAVG
jgi:predicted XRE-type DNA-binding protein